MDDKASKINILPISLASLLSFLFRLILDIRKGILADQGHLFELLPIQPFVIFIVLLE